MTMTKNLPESASAAGTALVVCKDARTRQLILESLQPLAIRPEFCEEGFVAASLLDQQKFEAVIVDLLLGDESLLVLAKLRFSRANRTAVTFAITTGSEAQTSPRPDSTFVLERPLSAALLNQTLRAAFGLVVRERRRYFRCPIAVPAFVRSRQPEDLECQTVNISEGGIAINAPAILDSDAPALVRFSLPGRQSRILAETRVCWRGHDGLVGLEFHALASPQKSELQEWLARKLDETLPENVAALFRGVGRS
ncbi:MAG: PilZ domain-containing protein [Candidatus Sulfotelmatobacter sp.]